MVADAVPSLWRKRLPPRRKREELVERLTEAWAATGVSAEPAVNGALEVTEPASPVLNKPAEPVAPPMTLRSRARQVCARSFYLPTIRKRDKNHRYTLQLRHAPPTVRPCLEGPVWGNRMPAAA